MTTMDGNKVNRITYFSVEINGSRAKGVTKNF
jgi:hypothetical protein